jgi:hypothetical protein
LGLLLCVQGRIGHLDLSLGYLGGPLRHHAVTEQRLFSLTGIFVEASHCLLLLVHLVGLGCLLLQVVQSLLLGNVEPSGRNRWCNWGRNGGRL